MGLYLEHMPIYFFHCVQANITEIEVSIPSKLHNSLIGSKGRFVRSIMEECGGVHIHFPTEGSGIDKVTIRGPLEEVEKAKQQLLALAEEKVCINYYLKKKINFLLSLLNWQPYNRGIEGEVIRQRAASVPQWSYITTC